MFAVLKHDLYTEIMKIKDEKTRNSLAKAFVTSVRDARQVTDGTGYGIILQTVNKNKKTAMDKGIEKYQTPEERAQIYVNAWKARGQEMSIILPRLIGLQLIISLMSYLNCVMVPPLFHLRLMTPFNVTNVMNRISLF